MRVSELIEKLTEIQNDVGDFEIINCNDLYIWSSNTSVSISFLKIDSADDNTYDYCGREEAQYIEIELY